MARDIDRQDEGTSLGQVITEVVCWGLLRGMALSGQEVGLGFPDLLTSQAECYRGEDGEETSAWQAVCLRGRRVCPVGPSLGWNPYLAAF